jgi:hypothetical protein
MSSRALQQFGTLTGYVDQLIAIHGNVQAGPGRRHKQEALHHAGVVMTVAAWESYIEKVTLEALSAIEAHAGVAGPPPVPAPAAPAAVAPAAAAAPIVQPVPAWAKHAFALRRAEIATLVKKFNTPEATKVRDLLNDTLEFNPFPHWQWHVGANVWTPDQTKTRLDQWVLIRHSVAHGFPLPANLPWILGPNQRPRLTLALLRECKLFFEQVVSQTDVAFGAHLHSHHGIPLPW